MSEFSSEIRGSTCNRCKLGFGDVQIVGCGCVLHTRCTRLPASGEDLVTCPHCHGPCRGISLLPLSFTEMDEAAAKTVSARNINSSAAGAPSTAVIPVTNTQGKRPSLQEEFPQSTAASVVSEDSGPRTGRWTPAETSFVDELIIKFGHGSLPIPDGVKLHDFLASILLCKGSRLTKKMKNAKLSTRSYTRMTGFLADLGDAVEFSVLEEAFFNSITCAVERSAIKFHMQRQWREMFCRVCSDLGQLLQAEPWLKSVEDLERRSSMAKVDARMKKRKRILHQDSCNQCDVNSNAPISGSFSRREKSSSSIICSQSPFLQVIMRYIIQNNIPFEHIDLWVPSFYLASHCLDAPYCAAYCKLVFAGCATAPVDSSNHFSSFGKYSEGFSFEIGRGIPGKIYESGVSVWNEDIQLSPTNNFERLAGSISSGIRTVVGIPIPCQDVGRVILMLYSCYSRKRYNGLLESLKMLAKRLLPKVRFVVDTGCLGLISQNLGSAVFANNMKESQINSLKELLAEHMPSHESFPFASHLPAFISLRLLLFKTERSDHEMAIIETLLCSYQSYKSAGRLPNEIASLLALDFMFLMQQPVEEQTVNVACLVPPTYNFKMPFY